MKHRTWLGLQAEFWHAHFNYAALRTDPALAAFFFCCIAEQAIKPYKATNTPNPKHNTKQKEHGKCLEGETRGEKRVKRPKRPRPCGHGSMDSLAGDQICQWNSVTSDFILPATRLSVFVPPPLGAFVLANHQNHEDFKSTPASATHSSPIFSVQQNIQFPLPQVFSNQDELLSLARLSASEGYLSEEVIPFLGHSNQQMTFKKKGINQLSPQASMPFSANISRSQVVELIKARHSHDEKSVQLMRNQFRNNKVELRIWLDQNLGIDCL